MIRLPKRRWLTFSVRTLLVAVTIFCVWLAWQVSIVRERSKLRRWAADHANVYVMHARPLVIGPRAEELGLSADILRPRLESDIPWHRTLLGDESVQVIAVYSPWRDEPQT